MICDSPEIVNIFINDEPKPISEGGKRVVTSHGDWHPGNMLTRDDGSVISIDLEMVYVGFAHYDAAYFTQHARLSRAQIFEYATEYLRVSGLDTSEKSVREFVFDIEQARVFCQVIGLNLYERGLKKIEYKESFTTDAITLLSEAQSDKAKFDLVVDNGLYHAMFKNNSELFAGLMEKFGKEAWFFNPEFDVEHTVLDQMNS